LGATGRGAAARCGGTPIEGGLNLILLDRYMDGVPTEEAAQQIKRSAGWMVLSR
jgi:hypothetical protein